MRTVRRRKMLTRIRQDVTVMMRRLQGKDIVHVLHIGKTGGSAVKSALEQYSADHRYFICLHPHAVKLRDVRKGDHIIFFVRDPIGRFVSGFRSRQRQGRPRYDTPWSQGERSAFEHFKTPNDLAVALSSPDAEVRDRAQSAMRSIVHVRSSYWEWFEDDAYFKSRLSDVLFVGFQERLAQDFEALKLKLGLPEHAELSEDDVVAHRAGEVARQMLEEQAIENLKNWYSADYRFIALCKEMQ